MYIINIIYGTMQGSWIVRQSVGSTPCLLGKAVDCNYIRGPKYLEVIYSCQIFFSFLLTYWVLWLARFFQYKYVIWFIILQIDVDIGSSTVANGVLGLVIGVITSLVVDMAFLVQVCFS